MSAGAIQHLGGGLQVPIPSQPSFPVRWERQPAPRHEEHATAVQPPQVGPPLGRIVVATPFRLVGQVRNGVAMFGSGSTTVAGYPVMGAGAAADVSERSASRRLQTPGSSDLVSQALNLQHLMQF